MKIAVLTYSADHSSGSSLVDIDQRRASSIIAVARPGAPDYSASLTTPDVPDAQIAVRRLLRY